MMSLSNIYQAKGESQRDCLNQFHTATTEITDPKEDMVLMALCRGIQYNSNLGYWVERKQPSTMEFFYRKATEYLHWEDARKRPRRTDARSSNEPIQSNIAVKKSTGSFGNVNVKVGNQNKGGKNQ